MPQSRSTFSTSRKESRVVQFVSTLLGASRDGNDEREQLIESDEEDSTVDEEPEPIAEEGVYKSRYSNPDQKPGTSVIPKSPERSKYEEMFNNNEMDGFPPFRAYRSMGLYVKLDPEGNLIFDLKNRKNVTGRGWEEFLRMKYCTLKLEKLVIDHVPDVNDLLTMLHPIFARFHLRIIPAVELFYPRNLNPQLFNQFLERYQVVGLTVVPIKAQLFEQPYLKKLEILYGSGETFLFDDAFLKEGCFAAIKLDIADPQVTFHGIKNILSRWLRKEIIICHYEFHIMPCCPRLMWPDVPVRQIRYHALHKGNKNYILKKFFGGDGSVKLIRADDKELKIVLRGTKLSLFEKDHY